ncbi:tripartite tricarboxylate transporter substrate binding protein [Caenimonas soli]|uniref:tripartite tricarboxylate transporter substrate binding protein n=1 Tax=Caenimonas soli TaxID=2735555 RepID=UPI001557A281|nr:tripartite tricarboxylate transporter substrate binding protein [Caenimonas soli]NPC58543.1 tripartite tricarboxylate transporter substrate binding protein [Caenimonas soli]
MFKRCALRLPATVLAVCLVSLCTAAVGQEGPYPARPITLIVPFPPGGAADGHLRTTAELLSKQLGQSVVVVNRPGASGTLGPTTMARSAKPDGYTISQMATSAYRLPFTQKVDWDPLKDFTFIVNVADVPYGVLVHADSPWNSLADVVRYARENPGKVTFGTSGQITVPHLAMEELGLKTGAKMTLVPFKGYAEGVTALVGKHIDVLIESPSWEQMVATKRLKLLALTGNQRSLEWPDVPTLKELYGVVGVGPYGIVGPRGMDPKLVKTLHDAFRTAMDDPAYKASMEKFRQQSAYLNSQDYHDWAVRYSAEQKALLEKLGFLAR